MTHETARFTVVGAGAIGGTVGTYLARGGFPVRFVDADRARVRAMQRRGLTVEAPEGPFTVPVTALEPGELAGPLGTVLLAVKAQHTAAAVETVSRLPGPDEAIVSLQNGLNERTISRAVGEARTIGAFINFSADYLEPGRIRYSGPGDFYVGELDGHPSLRGRALAAALAAWGAVRVTDNVWGCLWSKLGYGNMLYATALVDADQADVIDRFRLRMLDLASEVCEVAHREGVRALGFHGFEPDLYLPRHRRDRDKIQASMDEMIAYMRRHQKPRSGIWRDLAVRKRKTDVDHQIGLAAEIGSGHGLLLPLTQRLITLIHEVEDGSRPMAWANVEELEALRAALAARGGP